MSLTDSPDRVGCGAAPDEPSHPAGSSAQFGDSIAKIFRRDSFALTVLVTLLCGVFYKTIFLGKDISRLAYMAEWDSAFNSYRTGLSQLIDPSAVLLAFPVYAHVASLLHHGQLPLWNCLNGCGAPLLADIQSTVLSPFHWLYFLFPSERTYNLQLVLHVGLAGLGMYALARVLKARPMVAAFAGAAYALCPFLLWYLELQTGQVFVLYPGLMWLFLRIPETSSPEASDAHPQGAPAPKVKGSSPGAPAASPAPEAHDRSLRAAIIAGIGAGLVVLAGHPECSLFAIIAATAVMSLTVLLQPGNSSVPRRVQTCVRFLAIAGVSAFCVSAPMLLPFVEFLKNSDCYKFGVSASAFAPWQALAYNMIAPGFGGASPFIGALCVPLIPWAFTKDSMRHSGVLCGVALFCLTFIAKLGPFDALLSRPPFNYLITVYCIPLFLISILALAAIGLENLCSIADRSARIDVKRIAVSAVLIGVSIALPIVFSQAHVSLASGDFDLTLPHMHVDKSAIVRDAIALAIAFAGFLIFRIRRAGFLFATLVAILNCWSVGAVAKSSLPATNPFHLPVIGMYDSLHASGERALGAGRHIANPNVNQLYQFADVRSRNALWPDRYLNFMRSMGAEITQYEQSFKSRLVSLLDIASIKYVLDTEPVSASFEQPGTATPFELNFDSQLSRVVNTVRGSLSTDCANRQAEGALQFALNETCATRADKPSYVLELHDGKDQIVWFSDRSPLASTVQQISVPLPESAMADVQKLSLYLKLFDPNTNQFLKFGESGQDAVKLASIPAGSSRSRHFQLQQELPGGIRLYRNSGALPAAYVVSQIINVQSQAQALEALNSSHFDFHKCAIVETTSNHVENGTTEVSNRESVPSGSELIPAQLTRPNANEVRIDYSSPHGGILVLTDTFYPGWQAYLDGKPEAVLRANYMFRGIKVPAGRHQVVFRFEPLSFWVGIGVFFSFVAGLTVIWIRSALRRKVQESASGK